MASADSIAALKSIGTSASQRVSFLGLSIPITGSSTLVGLSEQKATRLTTAEAKNTTALAKLADFQSLKNLLQTLNSAAASLRNSRTSSVAVDVLDTISSSGSERVDLDINDVSNLRTGDQLVFTSVSGSFGVTLGTTYYVKVVSTDANSTNVQLFTSRAAAIAGTSPVDITANNRTAKANQIVYGDPHNAVTDFFDAFNDVQTFLKEKTVSGKSLQNESAISGLANDLTNAISGLFTNTSFSNVINSSSGTDVVTIDEDALTSLISSDKGSVVNLFEGSGGIAKVLQTAIRPYVSASGVLNTLTSSLKQSSSGTNTQFAKLLDRAASAQTSSLNQISSVAGALVKTQKQISFLSTLFS